MYMAYDTNVYIHTCIHIAHVTAYTYAVICVAMSLCTHSATASPAPPLRHRCQKEDNDKRRTGSPFKSQQPCATTM